MQMWDSGDIVMIRWRTTSGAASSVGERRESSPVHRLLRPFACMRTITRWGKGANQKGVAALLQAKNVCLLLFCVPFTVPNNIHGRFGSVIVLSFSVVASLSHRDGLTLWTDLVFKGAATSKADERQSLKWLTRSLVRAVDVPSEAWVCFYSIRLMKI